MADEQKDNKEETVEEKPVAKPKAPKPVLLNVVQKDKDGKQYCWTMKSGMKEPVKIYL